MNIGSNIGQYRILRKIGAGGMGTIYLGEHILLGRRAAIKTLLPSLSVHKEVVDRFFNEARATSAISDAGVVQVYDFGYHVDGTAYIVMELLEGESLSTRIERLGRLPVASALRLARQAAASLGAAHAKQIVHRDLKPENIFLVHDAEAQGGERTKILDFGICKVGSNDASVTQTGTMMGTPVYMSPEQCRGAGDIDNRSDIYALGGVLFHALTGRTPFECSGSGEFIAAHLREDPPAPSTYLQSLPFAVDEVVLRCLAKSPDDRFQTMEELQAAIEQVLGELDTPAPVESAAPPSLCLEKGFRSAYNGNFGSIVATLDSAAAAAPSRATPNERPVIMLTSPRVSEAQSSVGLSQIRKPRRAAVALLVATSAIAALFAARFATNDEAIAEPSLERTVEALSGVSGIAGPTVPAPTPSATLKESPTPRETAAASAAKVEPMEPMDRVSEPVSKQVAKQKQKLTPQRRPARTGHARSSSSSPEDLYDTR